MSLELHGDTPNAPPGVFAAVFDGQHGWYWRNRTREVGTITLRTEGAYRALERLDR